MVTERVRPGRAVDLARAVLKEGGMAMTAGQALSITALILAVLALVVTGYPLLIVAVILLAIARLV